MRQRLGISSELFNRHDRCICGKDQPWGRLSISGQGVALLLALLLPISFGHGYIGSMGMLDMLTIHRQRGFGLIGRGRNGLDDDVLGGLVSDH